VKLLWAPQVLQECCTSKLSLHPCDLFLVYLLLQMALLALPLVPVPAQEQHPYCQLKHHWMLLLCCLDQQHTELHLRRC
jgi:hypothetical protein